MVEKNTPRGRLLLSSPEATALELIGYTDRCGGLDNVASVLAGLIEGTDPDRLRAAAELCPVAWVQRLGHLLDVVGHGDRADALVPYVAANARVVAPLVRARSSAGAPRLERWKLAVNAIVEPDQ